MPPPAKFADIGGQEGNPEGQQAVLRRVAFGYQEDREPVGHEEPDGVGQRFREDDAPGLGHADQGGIGQPRRSFGGIGYAASQDELEFFGG